jgi:hypothetical protein
MVQVSISAPVWWLAGTSAVVLGLVACAVVFWLWATRTLLREYSRAVDLLVSIRGYRDEVATSRPTSVAVPAGEFGLPPYRRRPGEEEEEGGEEEEG